MDNQTEWQHVVVLGAAGKMGSGIALLLLQEMALRESGILTLLDTNAQGFEELRKYLRSHLVRYAERAGLSIAKEEFADNALKRVRFVTSIEECRGAKMVFEAIIEDLDVKTRVLHEVDRQTEGQAYFFTNTSSIPICILQQKSGIIGRLIGFHFYNPPAVQKLLEIIVPEVIDGRLKLLAEDIGRRLGKTIVYSNDVAGFIGNGHFIREIVEACRTVKELELELSKTEAICAVNRVTQEFLLRPMGIFQLIDYVGIDVCHHIAVIMTKYLPGQNFIDPLIEGMLKKTIAGGQRPDGSQKDGFFQYEGGHPISVYNALKNAYVPYDDGGRLGALPQGYVPWKELSRDPDRKEKIDQYFANLKKQKTLGAILARDFLRKSSEISKGLVDHEVARSLEDVNTVLKTGFFHL